MSTKTADDVIAQLADHQLNWDRLEHQIGAALHHQSPDDPPDHHMGPYVAVSGLSGSGGAAFAQHLGKALGWPVLDSEIVDLIAETFQLDGAMMHRLDEAKANWVREVLGDLMPHQVVNLDTYVHHLGKVMRLVALHGQVVLVGRGAHFFLPPDRGLSVRLIASLDERVQRVRTREGVDEATARQHVDDVDRRHAHFAEHYFARDVGDPALYDLVLNRSRFTDDELVDLVLTACRRRGYET
jgi:cytidylate kinase